MTPTKKVVRSVHLVYVTHVLNYVRCFPFSALLWVVGYSHCVGKEQSNCLALEMVFYSLFWRPQLLSFIHTLSELV